MAIANRAAVAARVPTILRESYLPMDETGKIEREPAKVLFERGARLPVRQPVLISWRENDTEMVDRAETVSISRGGCAISSPRFFRSGTRIRLEYNGKAMDGSVVYSLRDASGERFQTGIGFDGEASGFWKLGLGIASME